MIGAEDKACPWCGETILAVAKKCKHCGEFLESEDRPQRATTSQVCDVCGAEFEWKSDLIVHGAKEHGDRLPIAPAPARAPAAKPPSDSRERKKLSEVGSRTADGVLTCPKCGSTQFTAKRSMKGKLIGGTIGVATLGIAGPAAAALAPKSQVKCVACGTMYKRG